MPKFNRYRALHTTVIGPQGRPLEIQVRTREMHETAELGIAAHWYSYKPGAPKKGKDKGPDPEWLEWVRSVMDWQQDEADPREFIKTFRTDLFDDEVYVFTPKGEVKTLPAGSTPIDFAYAVHTDVGHRTVGAKVNGRIVPLHYRLHSGDFVEILTSKKGRGPSRDWMTLAASSRARNKIRQWFSRESREDAEQKGRESLEQALKAQNLPYRKLAGSAVLAQVIRETGFKKAEDFYVARRLGEADDRPDRQQGAAADEDDRGRRGGGRLAQDAEGAPRGSERQGRDQRAGRPGRADPARQVLYARPERRGRRLHLDGQGHHGAPARLSERACADAEPRAIHAGRVGRGRVTRASASTSRSTRGIARGCSRTWPGRSPSTAPTSSRTAAPSRTSSQRTGTWRSSATSSRSVGCSAPCAAWKRCSTRIESLPRKPQGHVVLRLTVLGAATHPGPRSGWAPQPSCPSPPTFVVWPDGSPRHPSFG